MKFINLLNISKSFTENKPLFKDFSLLLSEGDICGVIGRNGEGKTTLLKMIAGEETPDSGQIVVPPGTTIGYHTQFLDISNEDSSTIEGYILSQFEDLYSLSKQISQLSESTLIDNQDIEKLMELQLRFEEGGGYVIQSNLDQALLELNLQMFNSNSQLSILSGGQKTRLQLAKILVKEPDILLLDEPTNHLDSETIKWLENFVKNRKGITLIVSHDRHFLDNVTNKILEIEKGSAKLYFGNFQAFQEQKSLETRRNLESLKQANRQIKKLQEAANVKKSQAIFENNFKVANKKKYGKFAKGALVKKAGAKARMAKMMQKRIDAKVEQNVGISPKLQRKMHFQVEAAESTGDFVLRINGLDIVVHRKNNTQVYLIQNLNLEIMRGERVAIVGENGSGKTTLLRKIVSSYYGFNDKGNTGNIHGSIISGDQYFSTNSNEDIKFGGNVKIGFYSQEHEEVNLNLTVLEDFRKGVPMLESDASNYLHNMLFTYDQLSQKTANLSQGEKSKLALAKLLVQEHNFLILDEPTNHLDIASREVLETSLENYSGTILTVSHDKYFLEKIKVNRYYRL